MGSFLLSGRREALVKFQRTEAAFHLGEKEAFRSVRETLQGFFSEAERVEAFFIAIDDVTQSREGIRAQGYGVSTASGGAVPAV